VKVMEENLLGYLLQAEDAEMLRHVENYLTAHPEAQQRLELLRRALEPLAADADGNAPPELWVKALGRIAEFQCRALPFAPVPLSTPLQPRQWFRRADAVVAAAVLLVAVGLGLGGLTKIWHQHGIVACQNNLASFYRGMHFYSEHHNGEFPKVEAEPPRNLAGMIIPILHDAGSTSPEMSVTCPANGHRAPTNQSVQELAELQVQRPALFNRTMPSLLGC